MDLRGQNDMRKLEDITGRTYKPLKYWANFDPSDAKLVFDVRAPHLPASLHRSNLRGYVANEKVFGCALANTPLIRIT
jgi:hypothetical protein